jgi:hypothetical protein
MLMPQSMKLHPEFDLEQAKHAYSVSGFDTNLEGELVTGPHDLFSVEVLRDRHALRRGTASPTDVFVFGKGEATRRDGTKVGGLPYWPADRRWPKDEAGTPYRFLAQFNFADSRDLLVELPGEVLLLLVQEGDDWLYEPDRIHFEWLPLGLTPIASFPPSWTVNPGGTFFGAIHRSADYPDASETAEKSGVRGHEDLPIVNGTKIGGLPHLIQSVDLEGEFLCQLSSIQAAPYAPYPWVNDPVPLDLRSDDQGIYGDANTFVFLDMGNIYVFRDDNGILRSSLECY